MFRGAKSARSSSEPAVVASMSSAVEVTEALSETSEIALFLHLRITWPSARSSMSSSSKKSAIRGSVMRRVQLKAASLEQS